MRKLTGINIKLYLKPKTTALLQVALRLVRHKYPPQYLGLKAGGATLQFTAGNETLNKFDLQSRTSLLKTID